jgi:hypothetical protein
LGMASKEELKDRMNHCGQHHRGRPEIVKRSNSAQGFEVSLIRWVVERTLGWFNPYRGSSDEWGGYPRRDDPPAPGRGETAMAEVGMRHVGGPMGRQ